MFKRSDNDYNDMPESHTQHEEDYALDEVDTVVGPSVKVEGDFSSEGNMVIKGDVTGSVTTSKLLTAEEGSTIMANVQARDAVIAGRVKGNVVVADQLEITNTAQIMGDISCAVLVVEAGAQMSGKISMKGVNIPTESNETKRRPPTRSKTSKRTTVDTEPPVLSDEADD